MQASLLLLIGQTNYTPRTSLERTWRSNCVCVCVYCAWVWMDVFMSQVGADGGEKAGGRWRRGEGAGWGGAVQLVGADDGGGDRGGGPRKGRARVWISSQEEVMEGGRFDEWERNEDRRSQKAPDESEVKTQWKVYSTKLNVSCPSLPVNTIIIYKIWKSSLMGRNMCFSKMKSNFLNYNFQFNSTSFTIRHLLTEDPRTFTQPWTKSTDVPQFSNYRLIFLH